MTPIAVRSLPSSAAARAVERLRAETLVGICQAEVERMIADAELVMGNRVNELALAARLGVSRGPVREACRALVQAGLLESRFNHGFFVRRLTRKQVGDLYDLRAALMRLAGESNAVRATDQQIAALRALVDSMDSAAARGRGERFRELNARFHAALVESADNPRLAAVYQGLVKELRLFRRRALESADAMKCSNAEHRRIVEAVAARDPAAAAEAMAGHIMQGKLRFLAAAGDEVEA